MEKAGLAIIVIILFSIGIVALVLSSCNFESLKFANSPGSPGQVLTVGENGHLRWITPVTDTGNGPTELFGISRFYGTTSGTGSEGNDYSAVILPGAPVPFPRDGFISGGITRINSTSFLLPIIGTYKISWYLQTTEYGQSQLSVNNGDGFEFIASSVVSDQNPTEGGHPMSGCDIITTTSNDAEVMVVNPVGNEPSAGLTVTPFDGAQTHANVPFLIIKRIA